MTSVDSDTFISSLTTLKQLLHQQHTQQLKSPNKCNHTNVDEIGLRKKVQDAEMIIENERSLRKTLEKAFDELTANRKLLQEQLENLQQKSISSSGDQVMEVDSSNDWDNERIPLIKKIMELQEEAKKVAIEHEKYVQKQNQLEITNKSEIEKLQKQLEISECDKAKKLTEYANLQNELISFRSDIATVFSIVSRPFCFSLIIFGLTKQTPLIVYCFDLFGYLIKGFQCASKF
jgi:chromosome segregation ATPase